MNSSIGIGLRSPHVDEVLRTKPDIGAFEVYSEDYMGAGSSWLNALESIRTAYPLSLHGVGLSIASADRLNMDYLRRLRALIDRYEPLRVSDHLAWSSLDNRYFCDQYPVPRRRFVLRHLVSRVIRVQDFLKRPILLENIAIYLKPEWTDEYSETDFLIELVKQTGCQLLLDVENLSINVLNHGGDAAAFIESLPQNAVTEIHLAGGEQVSLNGATVHVDTHSRAPSAAAQSLFRRASARFPNALCILEWDADLPALAILLATAQCCVSGLTQ
ncbi:DUF692 domain-containing protein [Acidithiobacillus sulfuriphilus]|uniref:DUF692 domain-containing protein n=1 Tax=Acidithiobacillus sulfuriphilus TaxID=1867749 RepID=UPI003F5E7080